MRVTSDDRAAAAELLARYAELIDAGDFEGVGRLLGDAVLRDAGGAVIATGADEITAIYLATTRRHADGTPRTAHVITNVIVEGRGPDELEMRSRFTVLQCTDTLALQPVVAGRYVDRLARSGEGWRFAERTMIPQFWGDVGEHLTFDPRSSGERGGRRCRASSCSARSPSPAPTWSGRCASTGRSASWSGTDARRPRSAAWRRGRAR